MSARLRDNEPERLICSECGFIFYQDPKLVACSIVEVDKRIILLKRSIMPAKGMWVVPGGYVDRGEVLESAAMREALEECGIEIKITDLLGVYSYPGLTEVVVFYIADYVSGTIIAGDESLDISMVDCEEIPWDRLAFRSTKDALRDYCELKKKSIKKGEL